MESSLTSSSSLSLVVGIDTLTDASLLTSPAYTSLPVTSSLVFSGTLSIPTLLPKSIPEDGMPTVGV